MEHDDQNRQRPTAECPELASREQMAQRLLQPNEDPHEFNKIYDEVSSKWHPGTFTEWLYFERIVANRWLLRRLDDLETAVFAQIGRTVWESGGDADFLGTLRGDWRRITGVLRSLAKGRAMKAKSAETAIRILEREISRRERAAKRPAERVRGPKIADLEPVTRSIQ